MMPKEKETIVVFSAHPEDYVVGAGGTIARYRQEGKKVITVIFSHGERGRFWVREKEVKRVVENEARQAASLLGCSPLFLGLADQEISHSYQQKNSEQKLLSMLRRSKPTKVFTHSQEDPHPDHRAVYAITLSLYEKLEKKPEVYSYAAWNLVSFKTQFPALYINVSKTFGMKLKALRMLQSQRMHIFYPTILLLFRALKDSIGKSGWFQEHFFRIR